MPGSATHLTQATEAPRREWSFLARYNRPLESIRDRSTVCLKQLNDQENQTLAYIKIYANRKHPLPRLMRKIRSRNEVRNLLFFRSVGIATPRIIAWGQKRNAIGRAVQDFIISEAVPKAQQLCQDIDHYRKQRFNPKG
jgi:hypothetical protein